MQPCHPITARDARAVNQVERPSCAADIETENAVTIAGVFKHPLAAALPGIEREKNPGRPGAAARRPSP